MRQYKSFKLGDIQSVADNQNNHNAIYYGFSITDSYGGPLFGFAYRSNGEAKTHTTI